MSNSQQGRRIRIAVLFGGQSDEHDVSIRSAQTVINAIDTDRYDAVPIGITREGRWIVDGDPMAALVQASEELSLRSGGDVNGEAVGEVRAVASVAGAFALTSGEREAVDVVFPVLHGPFGEDGSVQGLLEVAGVPYVGSGVLGSAVAMDKAMTKHVLTQVGIPQLPWQLVTRRDIQDHTNLVVDRICESMGLPCFTKPANLGSSVGIARSSSREDLVAALHEAAYYDRRVVVEKAIDAREIELSVLGNEEPIASVAGEIVPRGGFYDYAAKYLDNSTELIVPARLDPSLLGFLQEMAIDAFRALDLAGMARVDFFIERGTDQVYLNEVNTLPGFTSISMYPMLWEASGIPISELINRLVGLALDRHSDRKRSAR
ncbi:MAG TPA: D-alanine--D-alanine ligase family protein [Thermomicrobiales bacterium]|nr:D-alanine--D-alanine ligase family protein [Thermomicrobiales bacterium]